MKRHIGKIRNTDQRIVVVFMQIPGRTDHALVVSTDNLPPKFEQAMMDVVESAEAQGEPTLGTVLSRRLFADSGRSLLETLHNAGLLRAVHVDQVIMLPQPNMPFPLRKIIEQIGDTSALTTPSPVADDKFNPHTNNVQARSGEEKAAIARNLLIEAEMLQAEADRKRAQADAVAGVQAAPKPTVAEVVAPTLVETVAEKPAPKSRKKTTRKKKDPAA